MKLDNNTSVAIIGLGYVGLPLAVEFGKKYKTIGFDINTRRVNELRDGIDHTLEVESEDLRSATLLTYSTDVELLRDANVTGGETELVKFMRAAVATRSDKQSEFGLFKLSGRKIAGNMSLAPTFRGWGLLPPEPGQSADNRFLGYVEMLDDNVVVAGRSQRFLDTESGVILNALILSGLVICLAALGIGYFLNRGVSQKLAVIDGTLAEVSHGNSGARLPVGRSNDQIDHVSRQINAHLDRLSELMANMRNSIVAIAHDLKSPMHRAYMLLQEAADEPEPRAASSKLRRATGELEALGGVLDALKRHVDQVRRRVDRGHRVKDVQHSLGRLHPFAHLALTVQLAVAVQQQVDDLGILWGESHTRSPFL